MLIWAALKQSLRIPWCCVRITAFHCLCSSENRTWSIFKVSDQNKHIWKLQITESAESNNWVHLFHRCKYRHNPGAHGLWELNRLSWEAHTYYFPAYCGRPPMLALFPHVHIWCFTSETREGGEGEEPEAGESTDSLCHAFSHHERGQGLFSIGI